MRKTYFFFFTRASDKEKFILMISLTTVEPVTYLKEIQPVGGLILRPLRFLQSILETQFAYCQDTSNVERVSCLCFVFGHVLFLTLRLSSFGENPARSTRLSRYLKTHGHAGNKNVAFDPIRCLGVVCPPSHVNSFL